MMFGNKKRNNSSVSGHIFTKTTKQKKHQHLGSLKKKENGANNLGHPFTEMKLIAEFWKTKKRRASSDTARLFAGRDLILTNKSHSVLFSPTSNFA